MTLETDIKTLKKLENKRDSIDGTINRLIWLATPVLLAAGLTLAVGSGMDNTSKKDPSYGNLGKYYMGASISYMMLTVAGAAYVSRLEKKYDETESLISNARQRMS